MTIEFNVEDDVSVLRKLIATKEDDIALVKDYTAHLEKVIKSLFPDKVVLSTKLSELDDRLKSVDYNILMGDEQFTLGYIISDAGMYRCVTLSRGTHTSQSLTELFPKITEQIADPVVWGRCSLLQGNDTDSIKYSMCVSERLGKMVGLYDEHYFIDQTPIEVDTLVLDYVRNGTYAHTYSPEMIQFAIVAFIEADGGSPRKVKLTKEKEETHDRRVTH